MILWGASAVREEAKLIKKLLLAFQNYKIYDSYQVGANPSSRISQAILCPECM